MTALLTLAVLAALWLWMMRRIYLQPRPVRRFRHARYAYPHPLRQSQGRHARPRVILPDLMEAPDALAA